MARNNEAVNSYHLTSFVCKTASFCIHLPFVMYFVCKTASFCIQLHSVTSSVCTRGYFCTREPLELHHVCTRPAFCTRKLTLSRSWRSEGLHSWQLRQPTAKSKLRELRHWARYACFVPATQSCCYFWTISVPAVSKICSLMRKTI